MGYNNNLQNAIKDPKSDDAALKKTVRDVLDVSQRCYVLHILSFTFHAFKTTFRTFEK
jgi:hypothetical protein